MTIPKEHIHITERESDGSWEDCTWCSGLEWYRLVHDASKPATHAEAEALRAASGKPPTGGSNLDDFARGVKARYGVTIAARVDNNTLPKPGQVAVVQGSMSAFGPTNPLSKWDPSFDGGHAVCVMNIGGVFYWCDPEAPTGAAVPVVISQTDLLKFINAFAGASVIGPIKSLIPTGDNMRPLTTYIPGYTASIKPQSHIRADAAIGATLLRTVDATADPVVLTGTVKGDVDPANGSDVWYVWFEKGIPVYTAKDNVLNIAGVGPSKPAYPDLSAELAAANAATKDAQAKEAAAVAAAGTARQAGRTEQYEAIRVSIEKGLPKL